MINLKGRVLTFTGKDYTIIKNYSDTLGLSLKDCVTGMLWEGIMRKAREGVFVNGKKKESVVA